MRTMIRNKCLVEIENDVREVVAKATRADELSAWHFGAVIDGKMTNCGELYAHIPEILGRRLVLAILGELLK